MESATEVLSIPMKNPMAPSYYHSFGLTQNYIVFPEMPLKLSIPRVLARVFFGLGDPAGMFHWNDGEKVL